MTTKLLQLEFGNPIHIAYMEVKAYEDRGVLDFHSCNCDHCDCSSQICPYCGEEDDNLVTPLPHPYITLVECEMCGEEFFPSLLDKQNCLDIIKKVEKDIPRIKITKTI